MATTSPKLSLRKPATTDLVSVTTDISENMDKLDAPLYIGAAGDDVIGTKVTGDTQRRFNLNADGSMEFGPGNAIADILLNRASAGILQVASGLLLPHKVARKTADEPVNNSATLQNDDHLFIAIAANEIWYFDFFLRHSSGIGSGFKLAFTIPAAATMSWVATATEIVGNPGQGSTRSGGQDTSGTSTTIVATSDTTGSGRFFGSGIVICGATPGNLQLQWAQAAATAHDTKLLTNSILIARRIA